MAINHLRLLSLLLIALIFWSKNDHLYYYLGAMLVSVEFLNSRKTYHTASSSRIFNTIFASFTLFIIVNRTRTFQFSNFTEGVLNLVEHGFFALVICLKIAIYLRLFSPLSERWQPIVAVLLFNGLGIFNEIFQNYLNQRPILGFIAETQKDIMVNGLGSVVFLFIIYILARY
jgi:Fe2+ transport system protein B